MCKINQNPQRIHISLASEQTCHILDLWGERDFFFPELEQVLGSLLSCHKETGWWLSYWFILYLLTLKHYYVLTSIFSDCQAIVVWEESLLVNDCQLRRCQWKASQSRQRIEDFSSEFIISIFLLPTTLLPNPSIWEVADGHHKLSNITLADTFCITESSTSTLNIFLTRLISLN